MPEFISPLPMQGTVNISDLDVIQQWLDKTDFGLDLQQMLAAGFRTEAHNGQVYLALPPPMPSADGKIHGTDEALACMIAAQLQPIMGNRYEFQLATGGSQLFPASSGSSCKFLLATSRFNPRDQLIIDPSAKLVSRPDIVPQYRIESLKPLNMATPGLQTLYVPMAGLSQALLLGTAKDLLPEATDISSKTRLYLLFETKNGVPSPMLGMQPNPHSPVIVDPRIDNYLPPFSPISRFLYKVQTDLQSSVNPFNQMSSKYPTIRFGAAVCDQYDKFAARIKGPFPDTKVHPAYTFKRNADEDVRYSRIVGRYLKPFSGFERELKRARWHLNHELVADRSPSKYAYFCLSGTPDNVAFLKQKIERYFAERKKSDRYFFRVDMKEVAPTDCPVTGPYTTLVQINRTWQYPASSKKPTESCSAVGAFGLAPATQTAF